jgi:maltose-binding protein MalE
MFNFIKKTITLLYVALLAVACNATSDSAVMNDRLLVWHAWTDAEAAELQALIDEFTELNPNTRIIVDSLAQGEPGREPQGTDRPVDQQQMLYRRYVGQTKLGLGPDLLIGPSGWVRPLADAGLIQDINGRVDDTSNYLSTAVETLRHQLPGQPETGLYGLPLTLETSALYYNKSMVATPADTIDTLQLHARDGQKVALNSSFGPAFWGVSAFGGQLFNEEGRVMLDLGGFANWLSWLKTAQTEANIILEDDQSTLKTLFMQGEVAYLPDTIDSLPQFEAALGQDAVGVVPLPRGPNQPAGPFLRTEAAMINTHSSNAQSDLALRLAEFLASTAQQTKLMRQTNKVPANNRVRVDPQVYPVTAAFLAQARTAVPYPNRPQMDTVDKFGNEAYLQALTGAVSPNEVARIFTNRVNEAYGFEPINVEDFQVACNASGQLEVWHRWPDSPQSAALQTLADTFTERCPAATISFRAFETDALRREYTAAGGQERGPDIVIAPSTWLPAWARDGLVSNLTGLIEPEWLQQYNATAINALQFEQGLYGIPLWLDLMALYYRTDQVTDIPRVFDDFLNQTDPTHKALLPVNAADSAWSAFAFGSMTYDENFNMQLVSEGMVSRVEWLRAAQTNPGVVLSLDAAELKEMFKDGEGSYYVGKASELTELQQALGSSVLRVASIPAGPAGDARPQLEAEAVMFSPATLADVQQAELAIEFGRFISNRESQNLLMQRANVVPGHVNVDTTNYPAIAGFLQQAETAGAWWVDSVQDDPAVSRSINLIFDTMLERAVFGREDIVTAVDEAKTAFEELRETAQ